MPSFKIIPSAVAMTFLFGLISASSIRIEMTNKARELDGGIQASIKDLLEDVEIALNPIWDETQSMDANFHCGCGGSHCRCCRVIRVPSYPRYCCVIVDYRHHSGSLEFSLEIGHHQLFDREISLRDHPPICARLSFLSPVTLCLGLNEVRIWGHRDRACAVVTVRSYYYRRSYSMGCFSVIYRDQEDGPTRSIGPTNSGAEGEMFFPADWIEEGEAVPVPEGSDLGGEQP